MNFVEKICYIVIFVLVASALASCNTLEPKRQYELAFVYPTDQPLPDVLDKSRIVCVTSMKDILKGETTSGWVQVELEKCRRLRGFTPVLWIDEIDPFFQYEYQKRSKKKK